MANPHPPYSHPGPSSYFHQPPPPPQFSYPPGAGAVPPYYHYPQGPPMNGHAPPPPASPRMNAGRGGYHAHRAGAPSYHHYQHAPQQYLHSQPMTPISSTPASPYAHPQKYPQHPQHVPYSPSYAPPNGPHPPAWQNQPLSPLPKQFSMLPPSSPSPVSQPYAEAPSLPPSAQPSAPEPATPPRPDDHNVFPPSPVEAQSPPRFHHDDTPSEALSSPKSTARARVSESAGSHYVVWSRKPRNPSLAPGIIISVRAHPPEDVLQKALDLPTPPVSPIRRVVPLPAPSISVPSVAKEAEDLALPSETETSPTTSTAPATPIPGSPHSSRTSISAAVASPALEKQAKPLEPPESKPDGFVSEAIFEVVPPTHQQPSAPEVPQAEPAQPSEPAPAKPAPPKKSWASLLQPTDATASSSKPRLPMSSVVGFSIPGGALVGPASVSHPAGTSSTVRPEVLNLLNNGPTGGAPLRIRPRGLINTGNMCFANAVLQVLVYCQPFHRLFGELGRWLAGPVVGSQKEGAGSKATPLVDATIQFLKEFAPARQNQMEGGSGSANVRGKGKEREEEDEFDELDSFIPTFVYEVMKEKKRFASMVGGHQEDAEEFLGFFLDTLEEELLSLTAPASKAAPAEVHEEKQQPQDNGWLEVGKKNRSIVTRATRIADSPITRIFGGKFRSTLRAPRQRDSVTVEDWRALRLDIQREEVHSVTDALQYISHPQAVQISTPTRPGVIVEATQQALIESMPQILVLHMKRFLYDTKVGDVVKIGKQVAFGPELEIGSDLITPARRTAHPVKYQLFGVLYHHGLSASGGHYTLDILHPNRDMSDRPRAAWIRIDDELVSDVRAEDVFGAQDRDDRCAYLLFYSRVGAPRAWSKV